MKVLAARSVRDQLRITATAGVWNIVHRYFSGEPITDRSRLFVEDLLKKSE
jgi:hypothetical protein